MDNIIIPNNKFDFSKLTLAHPIGIQGGAYFTKIEYNNKPLYIQTSKSLTRQGFVKSGKKYYCDLMFDNNSSELIHWFEKLEEQCQKLIFQKSDAWFEGTLEESDVESAFNPVIRVYKSGKFYLVRTNIKNNSMTNDPIIKIYNEDETPMSMNEVNNESKIMSILEILGIKFTSRNFQIDIEMKQAMVLNSEPIFDNCLIKTSRNHDHENEKQLSEIKDTHKDHELNNSSDDNISALLIPKDENTNTTINTIGKYLENLDTKTLDTKMENVNNNVSYQNDENTNNSENNMNNIHANNLDNIDEMDEVKFDDLIFDNNNPEIEEVDLSVSLENNSEVMKLKKPNQVYYELYKEARNKAKEAKKLAIIAFLEAKKIKKTYMIENMDDSDEIDEEIDEISDSELEGF